jgi:hypothetical protein
MRVLKGDELTGEVILNRVDQDELMTLLYYNTTRCAVFRSTVRKTEAFINISSGSKRDRREWEEIAIYRLIHQRN